MAEKTYQHVTAKKRTLLVQSMDFSTLEKDYIRNCAGYETVIILRMQ